MTLISTITVGAGGAASLSWTGIPQTFTDLLLVCSLRGNGGGTLDTPYLLINGAYSYGQLLQGTGTSASGNTAGGGPQIMGYTNNGGTVANTFSSTQVYIPNYTSTINKYWFAESTMEDNATNAYHSMASLRSTDTAAVTTLTISPGNPFVQYSTASLYGITKGSGGATVA